MVLEDGVGHGVSLSTDYASALTVFYVLNIFLPLQMGCYALRIVQRPLYFLASDESDVFRPSRPLHGHILK